MDAQAIAGWAVDEASPIVPVVIQLYGDGQLIDTMTCAEERPDVAANSEYPSAVGFNVQLPKWLFDDGEHDLELRHSGPVEFYLKGILTPTCAVRTRLKRFVTRGNVDGFRNGAVQGWAIVTDKMTGETAGRQEILVSIAGNPAAQIMANAFRPDVANVHLCDPACGFSFVPPLELMSGSTVEFVFSAVRDGTRLQNSPYRVAFPEMEIYDAIKGLQKAADKIFTELWQLRADLQALVPRPNFGLENYHLWALEYFDALSRLRGSIPHTSNPLISVICPSYKPRINDFKSAVESVFSQSYTNWELIVVDDASRDPDLERAILDFASRDPRVRCHFNESNLGISASTNVGLKMARGKYVALFDHDDALVDVALDLMVLAAETTGARLLYSDEDKLDDDGLFSEVNFKPGWNYRLLLSQNYICHLLMFERSLFTQIGLLDSECDGAQDHDLILRLTDELRPSQICHVPEVLYHWRKTPASTASSGSAKPYTVKAGVRAIAKHLYRKGITAAVSSPQNINCYNVAVQKGPEPKVTIIIPFRDQIAMTQACLSALREKTNYRNFEIVLIDNWSTSAEATQFISTVTQQPDVSVFRIEEPFNYSRLNNIAVSMTQGEMILFMNNDVIACEGNWLSVMVGEMQLDHSVGAVGNKLIYGNGLVQHAGVILGIGGIADHTMRGASLSDPGYAARGISAQELSAVTAACMLCRRTTFNAVGGFDQQDLRVAFNDVDLCLKIGKHGQKVVWTPYSIAIHHESLSRGSDFKPDSQPRFFHEIETMRNRWSKELATDRFYNPHFSRHSGIYQDLGTPEICAATRESLERGGERNSSGQVKVR